MFIGRETELKFLNDKYEDNKGQLIVLYGRRRVGKTETLREFCKDKPHIFFSCTQSTDKGQLAKFSKQILRENIPAKNYISEFTDWEKAFHSILDLPYGDKKKLIVIDEFPSQKISGKISSPKAVSYTAKWIFCSIRSLGKRRFTTQLLKPLPLAAQN